MIPELSAVRSVDTSLEPGMPKMVLPLWSWKLIRPPEGMVIVPETTTFFTEEVVMADCNSAYVVTVVAVAVPPRLCSAGGDRYRGAHDSVVRGGRVL